MAIARVLAVKRFRRQLMRLKHPEVSTWNERQLKNAIFRNGREWMDLLRWLLGELDVEIKECLSNCSDEERMSRVKESILVLGLSCPEKINATVQGRVIFKDREELVSQLIDLVMMKKAIDAGGTPCVIEAEGITLEDIQKAQNPMNNVGKDVHDKTEILSGKELFDLLLEKHPEYQRLMLLAANEVDRARVESLMGDEDNLVQAMNKMEALSLMSDGACSLPTVKTGGNQTADPKDASPDKLDDAMSKPKTGKCSCGRGKAPAMVVPEKTLDSPEEKIVTKEECEENSADYTGKSEQSLSLGWHEGADCENKIPIIKAEKKSGADAKPLNFLEAVHELVDDLERTFHVSE